MRSGLAWSLQDNDEHAPHKLNLIISEEKTAKKKIGSTGLEIRGGNHADHETESEQNMTTETQKPQRKKAAKSNKQAGRSTSARRGGVNYNFTLTKRQQAISRSRLDYPGDITLGQRWEAIRRSLIKELTAASAYLDAGPEADAWLERAVGEALVRGYALGLVHAVQGAGAEKSTPMTHEDGTPVMDVLEQQADHRPSDSAVAALHQQLREALPLENGASLIGRLRNDRIRLSAQEKAKREASPDEGN